MNQFIEALQWRAAIKQYNADIKLTDEQVAPILESARLAPTSYGLQPFSVVVVKDAETRAKLRAAAWDQPQVTDASHLIVFAVPTNLAEQDVERYMQDVVKARGVDRATLQGFHDMVAGVIVQRDRAGNTAWAARQAYIALGMMLSAAALERIDATPMEGFDPKQFDEILGLAALRLTSVVMCALGARAATDEYANLPKVRRDAESFFIGR